MKSTNVNDFGKFLRKLRVDIGETQRDMASKLGISFSYLSATEVSKRPIPKGWLEKIVSLYGLSPDEVKELNDAIRYSTNNIEVDLSDLNKYEKDLLLLMVDRIKCLEEEDRLKISDILKGVDCCICPYNS